MKKCTKCGKIVRVGQIITKPNQTEEQYNQLKKFCAMGSNSLPEPARDLTSVEGHNVQIPQGLRRPGVMGGWRMVPKFCGPLRDLTSAEISEQEELEKIEVLISR